jgi:hypothetical protein
MGMARPEYMTWQYHLIATSFKQRDVYSLSILDESIRQAHAPAVEAPSYYRADTQVLSNMITASELHLTLNVTCR